MLHSCSTSHKVQVNPKNPLSKEHEEEPPDIPQVRAISVLYGWTNPREKLCSQIHQQQA